MTTTTIGIRELIRNSSILSQYDYIDIEDKKTHEYKGLLISPKYADEFRSLVQEKILKEQQKRVDNILQYAGILDGETNGMSSADIKHSKKSKYEDK